MKIPDHMNGYFYMQKNKKSNKKRAILQARVASLKVFFKFCEFFLVIDLNPFVRVMFFHIGIVFAFFFAASIYEYPLDKFKVQFFGAIICHAFSGFAFVFEVAFYCSYEAVESVEV